MKTKSLSIFLVALFVAGMNLGAEEDNNENKKDENFKYEKINVDNDTKYDCRLKTILIGNATVGKSALVTKICKDNFFEGYNATIGFEYFTLGFKIGYDMNESVLKYEIWDCCGQEIYRSLITDFYRNARVVLLAYDVTNDESFKNIEKWVNDVKAKNTDKTIHFVLIGTKIDLNDNRKVPKEDGENFAKTHGMKFVEVSAKTGAGIKDLEYILAKISYEEIKKYNIYEEFKKDKEKKEVEEEKKEEDDSEDDFGGGEEHTHNSSLCDCCKKICENC